MIPNTTSRPDHRINFRQALFVGILAASVLLVLVLAVTKSTWAAVAYALVALFGFLFVLALYFWGAMLLGGILETFSRHKAHATWSIGGTKPEAPEHNIDPGLELIAAGILVYRYGEVKPRVYFRAVTLTNARAIRPFVVARTGEERTYEFDFLLVDQSEQVRFKGQFAHELRNAPQMVMPHYRLLLNAPHHLTGQRWNLRVRTGVTVVTSVRFTFVDGTDTQLKKSAVSEEMQASQKEMLLTLLDEAIKQDAMTQTQEIVLEGV